ncbi:MAG: hypothetical protein IJF10_00530 [Clostridia bacterium]|nr:hypothetical protein [Clostridia bacterium]
MFVAIWQGMWQNCTKHAHVVAFSSTKRCGNVRAVFKRFVREQWGVDFCAKYFAKHAPVFAFSSMRLFWQTFDMRLLHIAFKFVACGKKQSPVCKKKSKRRAVTVLALAV